MREGSRECGRPGLRLHSPQDFFAFIAREQWVVFLDAIRAARRTGAPFALGGGLAASFYTGLWRNTKDLDLYILPADREAMIQAMSEAGMADYFETSAYDRAWIYRSHRDGAIIDLIWALANRVADVDPEWLDCGVNASFDGETVPLIAPEEMFWSKLHVLQRDRCDWPDLLNLLYAAGPALDWGRLLRRARREEPLLAAVLSLFGWLAPGRARDLPPWLWPRLRLVAPEAGPAREQAHIDLLDSRPWFSPVEPV